MNVLFRRLMETPPSDGSAGGQTGAATTTGEASASASSSPAAGSIETPDFAELADWDESLEVAEDDVAPPSEPAAPVQPSAATQPGASTPPAASAPAAPVAPVSPAPPAAQATPPVQATPPAQEQPAAPAATPPAATEPPNSLEAHRAKAIPELEKLYALAPEELEEFRVTPETALPKLAAKLHFEVVMSAYQAVRNQLPELVGGFMSHQQEVQKANDSFFTKWPDLKDPSHLDQVKGAIKAYKAANPNASREQIINGAGAMVMISLGKNPFASAAPTPPAVSAVPPRPAGVGASGAPLPASAAQPSNDIEALSQAFAAGELD
jgi:DNA polymerase III subunit gamma/tau